MPANLSHLCLFCLSFTHGWKLTIYNGDVRRLSVTLQCLTLTDDASGVSFVSYTGDVGYEVDSRRGAVDLVGCGRSLVSSDLSHGGNLPHLASAPVREKTLPGLGFWVATSPPSSILECNTIGMNYLQVRPKDIATCVDTLPWIAQLTLSIS